jgi:hypothetical protein
MYIMFPPYCFDERYCLSGDRGQGPFSRGQRQKVECVERTRHNRHFVLIGVPELNTDDSLPGLFRLLLVSPRDCEQEGVE